ncbi:hypothetical protein GY45DRAFT_867048 [Cubamyces sp. BRFM 1775]|nr:hypothetical protein GY45DRAFT_867048 [Cubamyces sp. BRFM 1775]
MRIFLSGGAATPTTQLRYLRCVRPCHDRNVPSRTQLRTCPLPQRVFSQLQVHRRPRRFSRYMAPGGDVDPRSHPPLWPETPDSHPPDLPGPAANKDSMNTTTTNDFQGKQRSEMRSQAAARPTDPLTDRRAKTQGTTACIRREPGQRGQSITRA